MMTVRRSVTRLSDAEKAAYVNGVKALMKSGDYQWYVDIHANMRSMDFHEHPWFLPWHRKFILKYEAAIAAAIGDPDFAMPYWDCVQDWIQSNAGSGVAALSAMWCDDFMGHTIGNAPDGSPYAVTSGPFANTPTSNPKGYLMRNFGRPPAGSGSLPTQHAVEAALSFTSYDTPDWDDGAKALSAFRGSLEMNVHNLAHLWVGGSMEPMTSPNDPAFFLHHCNIDRLFAQWQDRNRTATYVPAANVDSPYAAGIPMWPWDGTTTPERVVPEQMWNYRALGYTYEDPWTGPTFISGSVPMTPTQTADRAGWGKALFGIDGWSLDPANTANPATFGVPSAILPGGITGVAASGSLHSSVGTSYICLSAPGLSQTTVYVNGPEYGFLATYDGWINGAWKKGATASRDDNSNYWYRLNWQVPNPPPSLPERPVFIATADRPFTLWAFRGPS